MKIVFPASLFIFFLALSGCGEKDKPVNCAAIANPTINFANPVTAGDTLTLTPVIAGNPQYISWTGPNNFFSSGRNVTLQSIQGKAAGRYTMTVNYGDNCYKSLVTDSLQVLIPAAPCLQPNSAAIIDGGPQAVNNVIFSPSSTSNLYTVSTAASGARFVLTFQGTRDLGPGYYKVQLEGGSSNEGTVRLRYDANSKFYNVSSGYVYVAKAGSKLVVSFCELVANSPDGQEQYTISASLYQP